jgi:hypothetical protein
MDTKFQSNHDVYDFLNRTNAEFVYRISPKTPWYKPSTDPLYLLQMLRQLEPEETWQITADKVLIRNEKTGTQYSLRYGSIVEMCCALTAATLLSRNIEIPRTLSAIHHLGLNYMQTNAQARAGGGALHQEIYGG